MTMVRELPAISLEVNDESRKSQKRRKRNTNSYSEDWQLKLPKLHKIQNKPNAEGIGKQVPDNCLFGKHRQKERNLVQRLGHILSKTACSKPIMIKRGSNYAKLAPIKETDRHTRNVSIKTKVKKVSSDSNLPKLEADCEEEPFSIRQKIEQFRKWNEEQANVKLSRMNYEHKDHLSKHEVASKSRSDVRNESFCTKKVLSELPQHSKRKANSDDIQRVESPPAKVDLSHFERLSSARTWRTWRDVNESYAYSDVRRYIQENKLLPKDKESWIINWVKEVQISTEIPEET